MKKVVVTGLGAITPIGNNVEEFWNGLIEGKCGVDNITLFDTTNFKVKIAAEVKNFNTNEYFDKKQLKRLDRYSQLAMVAAREVIQNSKLDLEKVNKDRFGVAISSGIGGLKTIEENRDKIIEAGADRVSPFFIPMCISNMAAGNVAIEIGAKGESYSITTACASATHAIGEAYRTIKYGYQDLMIAGGAEASITELGIAGFTNIKALSQSTDKSRASIPFDKERNGFVMGEGAGLILLEEYEHAINRGAKIYAEIVGFGSTTDAYHMTSPLPDGSGAAKAMKLALKEANILPKEVNYINAHGTSTILNDKCETLAIKSVFNNDVLVSSTKGHTGHLLGAAGGVEAIVCIKAIENSILPPTLNYKEKDEECDLDYIPNKARSVEVTYALSNSLGFGGHNSAILFKKY